jgi:hypothetical protein
VEGSSDRHCTLRSKQKFPALKVPIEPSRLLAKVREMDCLLFILRIVCNTNTLCGPNAQILNVKANATYSNHSSLKG